MKVEENNNNNYYLCYAHLISLGDSKTWCYGVFIPSLTSKFHTTICYQMIEISFELQMETVFSYCVSSMVKLA